MNTFRLLGLLAAFFLLMASVEASNDSPLQPGLHIAIVGNTFADQLRTNGYLETLLLQHWKNTPVSIRNLGWAGDTLSIRDRPTNFPTEASTLREHRTDVILACFGMGESFAGESGLSDFERDLRAFIASHKGKQYNGHSEVRLILISPIAYENLGSLTPNHQQRNMELKRYTLAMGAVASEEGIPFIDLFEPTKRLMNDPRSIRMTTNGIHLNAFGYWAVSHILYDRFFDNESVREERPWRLSVDTKTKEANAEGLEIYESSVSGRGFSFRAKEETTPSLPPPTDRTLPRMLEGQRDTMVVKNLEPGDYVLMIDGERVVSASHVEWAKGLAIDASPAHQEAEAFRLAVNDKNQQFVYGWKALNQVHIVGERRHSASGQALPAEVVEFKKIADRRSQALNRGIELKTREWRLIPDTN